MSKFRIRDIEAAEGGRAFGFLDVARSSTTMYKIPVAIFNGLDPGPTLCVLGGVHGMEYSSIKAVVRLTRTIDPRKLRGVLITVPVVNQAAFEARCVLQSPLDRLNLNRVFPGNPTGTMSYRVAHNLCQDVLSQVDCFVDCHGGEVEHVANFVIFRESEDEKLMEAMKEMAACWDVRHVRTDNRRRGTTSMCTEEFMRVPSITVESGVGGLVIESSVKFIYDGLINLMKYLKMIEGEAKKFKPIFTNLSKRVDYIAEQGGLFHPRVELGETVSPGQVIAEVTDVFGEPIQTVKATKKAYIFYMNQFYAVNAGEPLIWTVTL